MQLKYDCTYKETDSIFLIEEFNYMGHSSYILVTHFSKAIVHAARVCEYILQSIPGIPPIPSGYNPATWMLKISTPAAEERMGEDFAVIYRNSEQFR